MALKLVNLIDKLDINKQKAKLKPVSNTKSEEKSNKYADGQVVGKEYSDKMGQRKNVQIPKWMHPNAPIPDHVKDLKCEQIKLPNYYKNKRWIVLIRNVLTKQECDDLIQFSEKEGYEEALVNIGYGRQKKMPEFRNCKRMMIDSFDMVNCLWQRVQQFIPTYFAKRRKVSFNERLRFLKYQSGEFFAPHYDGAYFRKENGEISKITFLLYLNESFKGGQTKLLHPHDMNTWHAPKISSGMVLMFQHDCFHEGCVLSDGIKYIVRTDVMYTKKQFDLNERKNDEQNVPIKYAEYNGFDEEKEDSEDSK